MNTEKTTPQPQSDVVPLWRDPLPALFVFLWSTGFIGSKLGAPYSEPFMFLTMRFAAAAIIMAIISLACRAQWPNTRMRVFHAVMVGIMVHGLYLGGVFWAIDNGISAGISALIVSLQPLITGIAVGSLFGERVTPKRWFGLALGFTGVIMVIWQSLDFSFTEGGINSLEAAGLGACVLSLIGITAGTLYQRRFCINEDLRAHQTIQLITVAIIMAALSYTFETRHIEWSPPFIFALIWLTCIMSIGTFSLLYKLVRRGAASQVTGLFFMVPPITALIAYFLFEETPTGLAMAGMAVTVTGVAIATRK
ncbi:MAG: DMT family transporter [Rhodospirillales bacterium]|nr:DMT family transporter [Rhodospirillales bacterium]